MRISWFKITENQKFLTSGEKIWVTCVGLSYEMAKFYYCICIIYGVVNLSSYNTCSSIILV